MVGYSLFTLRYQRFRAPLTVRNWGVHCEEVLIGLHFAMRSCYTWSIHKITHLRKETLAHTLFSIRAEYSSSSPQNGDQLPHSCQNEICANELNTGSHVHGICIGLVQQKTFLFVRILFVSRRNPIQNIDRISYFFAKLFSLRCLIWAKSSVSAYQTVSCVGTPNSRLIIENDRHSYRQRRLKGNGATLMI